MLLSGVPEAGYDARESICGRFESWMMTKSCSIYTLNYMCFVIFTLSSYHSTDFCFANSHFTTFCLINCHFSYILMLRQTAVCACFFNTVDGNQ